MDRQRLFTRYEEKYNDIYTIMHHRILYIFHAGVIMANNPHDLKKIKLNDEQISITTLIPLWGRTVEARKKQPIHLDRKAIEFSQKIDYDFDKIDSILGEYSQLLYPIRANVFEDKVKSFIEENPHGVIINLGAGFDTTYYRVDNGTLIWYDLDLPEVINPLSQLEPATSRHKYLSYSITNYQWILEISKDLKKDQQTRKILILAAGLFMYFEGFQIKKLFGQIGDFFPEAEMIFDTISTASFRTTNELLKKITSNKQTMKWGISHIREVLALDSRIMLLDYFTIFERIKIRKEWSKLTKSLMERNKETHSSAIYHIFFTKRNLA